MTQGPSKGSEIGDLDNTKYGTRAFTDYVVIEWTSLAEAEDAARNMQNNGITVSVVKIVEVSVYKARP